MVDLLHACGVTAFSGLSVPAGENWKVFKLRLTGRKANAKVLVVLLTAAFYESKPCLEEVYAAIEENVALLPVRLEDKLPGKKAQWPDLHSQDEELMITEVQQKLGKINAIPHPGTLLTVPDALGEVFMKIGQFIGQLQLVTKLQALAGVDEREEVDDLKQLLNSGPPPSHRITTHTSAIESKTTTPHMSPQDMNHVIGVQKMAATVPEGIYGGVCPGFQ